MVHGIDLWSALRPRMPLAAALDAAHELVAQLGFTSVIYDYTPVPRDHNGELITPNVLEGRNIPEGMLALWRSGYYQLDFVQDAALECSAPFFWSASGPQSEVVRKVLSVRHRPVVEYIRDTRLSYGVTVPIHTPRGEFATFTAIVGEPPGRVAVASQAAIASVGALGQTFHDIVAGGFGDTLRQTTRVRLTRRERECLALCARGLTAKEIAREIGRSEATVRLHLNNAGRRLGARNSLQAVARASHYRLLDPAPRSATDDR